jgi:CRP/FNR family cyclic AMP-dependent transcriptional regulator
MQLPIRQRGKGMNDISTLKQVLLFSFMDEAELAAIRALMTAYTYAPGQVILREGERGNAFHVVVQGHVQILVQDAGGHELLVDEVGIGGFFGELSMLTGEPRSVRAKASDQVTTLVLKREEFFGFLRHHPETTIEVLMTLGQRLHRTDKLLRQTVSRNVNELVDERLTLGQRVADTIAEFSGSIAFLVFNGLFFALWLIWNQPWIPADHFDPFPFGLLTMIVSLEAIFLSIFLLVSQNRQAAKDRLAANIDHQVNTKAEIEIGLLLRRVDDLERSVHYNHAEQCALIRTAMGQG